MSRSTYDIEINKVVIDDHYKKKHGSYLNDQLILKIIRRLDGRKQLAESKSDEFSYYATLLEYQGNRYRVVWMLEEHTIYLGVINVYRDDRRSE